jgi:hypothetical protein
MQLSKKLITLSTVTVLGVVGGGSALMLPSDTSATEETPLVKQVEEQGAKLDNHETRITSTEQAVTDMNSTIGTATHSAPQLPTSSPTATASPAPAPVVVTSTRQVPIENSQNIDCEVTYSDGTVERWSWKVINSQGSWMLDEATQQGHWAKTTQISGSCN